MPVREAVDFLTPAGGPGDVSATGPAARAAMRGLSGFQLFNMAFGLAVGVGWIMLVGLWLNAAGPVGASLAFTLAAVAMLLIGQAYAHVARTSPVEGGEFGFAMQAFGRRTGFWVGWFLAMAYIVVIAFEMVALAAIARAAIPGLPDAQSLGGRLFDLCVGIAALLIVVIANLWQAAAAARFQDLLVIIKSLASVALVAVGLAFGSQLNLDLSSPRLAGSTGFTGFLTVLAMAPFFFAGFGPIAQAVKEARSPRTLERLPAIFAAVVLATLAFYVAAIWATALIAPREVLEGAPVPAAAAFRAGAGAPGFGLVIGLGALGLMTMLNGLFFTAIRLVQVLGEEALIPTRFARRYRTIPLASAALIVCASIALAAAGGAMLSVLANVATVGVCAAMAVMCAISVRLRREEAAPWRRRAASLLAVGVAMIMTLVPVGQAGWVIRDKWPAEWFVILAWVACGLLLRRRRSAL